MCYNLFKDKDKDSTDAKAESAEPIASGSKSHPEGETPKKGLHLLTLTNSNDITLTVKIYGT